MVDVDLIFIFPIDTASVTALTQISASMVVPSSPTYAELNEQTILSEEKASAVNKPVSPSPENVEESVGIEGDRAAPRCSEIARSEHERVIGEVLGRHLIRATCHHFERRKLDRCPRSMTKLTVCDGKSYDESHR